LNNSPPRQVPNEDQAQIENIGRHPRHIVLAWDDGQRSTFHHIWLRDNCTCDECGDRSGGHRYLELGSIDPDIFPDDVSIDSSGALRIRWHGDSHLTRYSPDWLRTHAYSNQAIVARQPQTVFWDARLNGTIPQWDYEQIITDDSSRLQMFEHIGEYGFAILRGVPTEADQIEQLAAVFGFIRQTHYGRVFELISTPQQRILAQTAHAIRPHNDELFRDPIPGLFMMHCLRASDCGGGASIFVDGFNAALKLKTQNPEYFDLLCRIPIPHHRFLLDEVDDVALAAKWPTIELNSSGKIVAVHINERTMAPLDIDTELVEPVYHALRAMLNLVYDPEACITYGLEAGQAAVLDNHRVLHARNAFNGDRHIRQCHVDRDEFFSRLRALHRRVGSDAQFREYV
jgi:alpha-ketoglutarate-dependent taurine dioxygenase